jgi:hypothetical protein
MVLCKCVAGEENENTHSRNYIRLPLAIALSLSAGNTFTDKLHKQRNITGYFTLSAAT